MGGRKGGGYKGNVNSEFKLDARLRLVLHRFPWKLRLGLTGIRFSPEEELWLSSTDTRLEVWNQDPWTRYRMPW